MIRHLIVIALVLVAISSKPVKAEIVSHPAGCPKRLFCGCGVSVKVFGHPVRDLFLAANWYRFPRAIARAGMVAIFGRHHVAYIMDANGNNATLYDPNSGGHATRIHTRSIANATIVNPNGSIATAAYSARKKIGRRSHGKTKAI